MYTITDGIFYVYTLAYPSGKVFYVGKGSGNRVDQHEMQARTNKDSHKCNVIRKIWKNGGEVLKTIVFRTHSEQAAYNFEYRLIYSIGLCNLTNERDAAETATYTHIPDPLLSDYHHMIYLRGKPGMTEEKARALLRDYHGMRLGQIADFLRSARRRKDITKIAALEAEREQIHITIGWITQERLFDENNVDSLFPDLVEYP